MLTKRAAGFFFPANVDMHHKALSPNSSAGMPCQAPLSCQIRRRSGSGEVPGKEGADQGQHFIRPILQREMPRVDEVELKFAKVALVRVCAVSRENLVVLAPDNKGRRLVFSEIGLNGRIQWQVGA